MNGEQQFRMNNKNARVKANKKTGKVSDWKPQQCYDQMTIFDFYSHSKDLKHIWEKICSTFEKNLLNFPSTSWDAFVQISVFIYFSYANQMLLNKNMNYWIKYLIVFNAAYVKLKSYYKRIRNTIINALYKDRFFKSFAYIACINWPYLSGNCWHKTKFPVKFLQKLVLLKPEITSNKGSWNQNKYPKFSGIQRMGWGTFNSSSSSPLPPHRHRHHYYCSFLNAQLIWRSAAQYSQTQHDSQFL